MSKNGNSLYWLKQFLRLVVIVLGGLHAYAAVISHSMNEDGICYLDIGDAYMRGDWTAAINSVWSPMYSWILGPLMHFINPTMRWEFPLVHLVNFIIYLLALICFEFFWRQIMVYHKISVIGSSENGIMVLPEWAFWALGYLIFIICSLHLIEIWAVTPDMLMSAFVYLAAGIILRIRMGGSTYTNFVLLGIFLGLGYLAKAILFPMGFFFLGMSLFTGSNIRRRIPMALAGLIVFLLLSGPFIALLSYAKGELTLSFAGKFTYAKHVNNVSYPHWQGHPPGNGAPVHPSRKIFDLPPVYEFGQPIEGTYPISYDPSYWYEGVAANYNLRDQFNYLVVSALYYFDLFFYQFGAVLLGALVLYFLSRRPSLRAADLISHWGLLVPAIVAFGFYALVNVTGRYIGVFVVLFWADILANVRVRNDELTKRLVPFLCALMIVFLAAGIIAFNLEGYRALAGTGGSAHSTVSKARSPAWTGEVAEALYQEGMKPGDKVAIIGYAFDSYWARLGRFKIVAEMFGWEADPFWLGSPSFQSRVIDAFRSTRANAIVAEDVPSYARLNGWRQINDTNYFVYLLGSK